MKKHLKSLIKFILIYIFEFAARYAVKKKIYTGVKFIPFYQGDERIKTNEEYEKERFLQVRLYNSDQGPICIIHGLEDGSFSYDFGSSVQKVDYQFLGNLLNLLNYKTWNLISCYNGNRVNYSYSRSTGDHIKIFRTMETICSDVCYSSLLDGDKLIAFSGNRFFNMVYDLYHKL